MKLILFTRLCEPFDTKQREPRLYAVVFFRLNDVSALSSCLMRVFFSDTLLFEALVLPCLSQERPSFSLIEKVLSGTESISAAYLGDAVIFRNWWQSTHSHGGRLAEDKAVRSRLKSRKKKFCLGAERCIWIPKKRAHTTEATRGCRIKPLDSYG